MSTTKLKDIAEAAGVSVDMVSRVLTGRTKGQWASTAKKVERIRALAEEMNYTPNKAAQVMRTHRSHQIGVVGRRLYNLYTGRVVELLEDELSRHGYGLVLGLVRGTHEEELAGLAEFSKNFMDGIINIHPNLTGEEMAQQVKRIPGVTFDRSSACSPAVQDMVGGVRLGLEHLWELGHRRIALITETEGTQDRVGNGYDLFYKAQSVDGFKEWIIPAGWTYEAGCDSVDRFLASGCTACLARNDLIAAGVCTELRARGYDIPKDFSVLAMDDTMLAKITYPPLTSLHSPCQELVELTVEGLLTKIEKRTPKKFVKLMPELIVRGSTGPVPR